MAQRHDQAHEVLQATDIVDVIGEQIRLERKGKDFVGLCPFHDDRKPSMYVVPSKQFFHCFVCNTGGDAIRFVREFHKVEFVEALRFLAERAGIKLEQWKRQDALKTADRRTVITLWMFPNFGQLPPPLQVFVVATRSRNPQWEIEDSVLAAMRPDCPSGIEATPSSRTRFRREGR